MKIRSSYNMAGVSFNPRELAAAIEKRAGFRDRLRPDSRQAIADTWPQSLDDSRATADWGWQARIGIEEMVAECWPTSTSARCQGSRKTPHHHKNIQISGDTRWT